MLDLFFLIGTNTIRRNITIDDIVHCNNPEQQFYVLKSPTFEQLGESDYALCKGYVKLLDATLNGATTTAERLGAYVVMTPESGDFGGILTKSDKDQIEKELDERMCVQ